LHGNCAVRGDLQAQSAKAPEDFTAFVDAVLAAATDAEPMLRYAAGAEVVPILPPILQALALREKIGLHLRGQG